MAKESRNCNCPSMYVKGNNDFGVTFRNTIICSQICHFFFLFQGIPSILCDTCAARTITSVSSALITMASITPDFLIWEYMWNKCEKSQCRLQCGNTDTQKLFFDSVLVKSQPLVPSEYTTPAISENWTSQYYTNSWKEVGCKGDS